MSRKTEWKKRLENKIKVRKDLIRKVREWAEIAADAEEENKKDEAKLYFVEHIPEEILDERGEPLFSFEIHDEERLLRQLPGLPEVTPSIRISMVSGSSDSSEYLSIAQSYRRSTINNNPFTLPFSQEQADKIEQVYQVFSDLADETARKQRLPELLNRINMELGEKFTITVRNYQKAKTEIVGIDQSAIQMRSVLEQLWGGMIILARKNIANDYKDSRFALQKENHRKIVAEALVGDDFERKNLILSLDKMASLTKAFSNTQFGKNQATKDIEKLNDSYKVWILTIDDVANSLYRNLGI
jgi:hypothetical protein